MAKKVDDKMKRNTLRWVDNNKAVKEEFGRGEKRSKSRTRRVAREFKRTLHIELAE